MKILIVGGGLGGMMLAASLQQQGISYELIEQSPRHHDQGFSLGVWCNTRTLFKSLGALEDFNNLGTPIHTYDIRDTSGRLLKAFRFDPFYDRYGMAYTQVNRHQLRELLLSKADSTKISFGTTLINLTQLPDRVEVELSNGQIEPFDLVVGADGVHSIVRNLAFGNSLQTYTGWRAWYVWIDKKFRQPAGMTEFLGPGRCLGIFDDGDRALAIFFAACKPSAVDDPTIRIATLQKIFKRELLCLPNALDSLSEKEVMCTDLATVRMKRWTAGRVVLLGDAAHAFEPHTGLGASMAMEDAHVLASEVAQVSNSYSVANAINRYEQLRQQRVAIAQKLNWQIRTFAFIRTRWMRTLANLFIPPMPEFLFTRSYFNLFDQSDLLRGKIEPARLAERQIVAKPA